MPQRRHLPHRSTANTASSTSSQLDGTRSGRSTTTWSARRLVCLENTHNRGGGRVYPLEKVEAISALGPRATGWSMHLDGARLWNAIVATGVPAGEWAKHFDSVSVCFSKGLGAPVGSAARRAARVHHQRAAGSASCSAGRCGRPGVLAAAALYALDHHVERLADDHRNAQVIAQAVADTPGLRLDPPDVRDEPGLVRGRPGAWCRAPRVAAALKERGVLVHPAGPTDAAGLHPPGRVGRRRRVRGRRPAHRLSDARPRPLSRPGIAHARSPFARFQFARLSHRSLSCRITRTTGVQRPRGRS